MLYLSVYSRVKLRGAKASLNPDDLLDGVLTIGSKSLIDAIMKGSEKFTRAALVEKGDSTDRIGGDRLRFARIGELPPALVKQFRPAFTGAVTNYAKQVESDSETALRPDLDAATGELLEHLQLRNLLACWTRTGNKAPKDAHLVIVEG